MDLTVERRDLRDAVRSLIAKAQPTGTAGTQPARPETAERQPTETQLGEIPLGHSPLGQRPLRQTLLAETQLAQVRPDRSPWGRLCGEIGVAGLAIPERYGGAGAGLAEICVVMEELGRNLTPTPMLGSAVLAAQAVLASGDDAACARLLPAIADGSAIAALAWTNSAGQWDTAELGCKARRIGPGVSPADSGPVGAVGWELPGTGGSEVPGTAGSELSSEAHYVVDGEMLYVLEGEAHYVLDGEAADVLLVAARTPDGSGLFEVSPRQDGVARSTVATMDATRPLAVVRLTGAVGRRIGGDAAGPLAYARGQACIALGAEQVGAAQGALELTVGHLLTRVQFGQLIGGFQALQHRAADLYVLVESARSLSRAVALAADEADGAADPGTDPDPDPERGLRAAAVKVYCSETLTQTAGEMIQLHGAIGVTWEHRAHRYLKRAHGGRYLFGSPASHLAAIAASLIDG
jgi:alkylation response protein AidB-like acyl-CoA dehydrogenase